MENKINFDPSIYRGDFPPLDLKFDGKPPVYLDNACVTLRPRRVIEACSVYYEKFPGCHKRTSHKFARETTERFEKARSRIAGYLNVLPEEIIFTKNTTEGLNLVANSFQNCAVLTSELEHNSNIIPWLELSRKRLIERRTFKLNPDLTFNFDSFSAALDGVKLVSVPHKSHMTGCEYPIKEIIGTAHEKNALVAVDGAQAAGSSELDLKSLGADFYAFSAHKMAGPAGFGVLFAKKENMDLLKPLTLGGETVEDVNDGVYNLSAPPYRFEAGLQNYPAALGLEAAFDYLSGINRAEAKKHVALLNSIMTEKVLSLKKTRIIGPENPELRNNVLNFRIEGADSLELARMLDETENIMVRAGKHCSHEWFNRNGATNSVRASLYFYNTRREAELFADTLGYIIKYFY